MDFQEILRILKSLEAEAVEYAIFGAVALNLHGIIRATEDLDLFVKPTVDNLERLLRALRAVYDDPHIDDIDIEELMGEYPAVRYYPPESEDHQIYLDILTRLGEFAKFDRLEIEEIEIENVKVRVVSPRTLYWLKNDTIRDKDHADAALIKEKFDLKDDDIRDWELM